MRFRCSLRALLLTSVATAVVLGAAAPGVAGSDRRTHQATVTSEGAVYGHATGEFDDVVAGTAWDRIWASPTRSNPIAVTSPTDGKQTCKTGAVELYGADKDWANAADTPSSGQAPGGILRVDCTYADGSKHRFFWGTEHYGTWSFRKVTYCLEVRRATLDATTTYSVTTKRQDLPECLAQEQRLDNAGNILYSTGSEPGQPPLQPMSFTATFTVRGKVSTAPRP